MELISHYRVLFDVEFVGHLSRATSGDIEVGGSLILFDGMEFTHFTALINSPNTTSKTM